MSKALNPSPLQVSLVALGLVFLLAIGALLLQATVFASDNCNGANACRESTANIGQDSCNNQNACRKSEGTIDGGSCNGVWACSYQNQKSKRVPTTSVP